MSKKVLLFKIEKTKAKEFFDLLAETALVWNTGKYGLQFIPPECVVGGPPVVLEDGKVLAGFQFDDEILLDPEQKDPN